MANSLFPFTSFVPALTFPGLIAPAAKMAFYLTGTTTLATVYDDDGDPISQSANGHGIVGVEADGFGRFPNIYTDDATTYRVRLMTALGVQLGDDIDPYQQGYGGPSGATRIGYQATYANALARTQADRDMDQVSLFDWIPQAMHAAILARTSTEDPTPYIVKAITDATSQRRKLWVPAGLYNITPATTFAGEAGTVTRAFPILSNMHIEAEEGATFRLANGVSSDASPKLLALFATNQVVSDISITGLEMDMNGANNPISPNRGSGVFNLYDQAMFDVTGTPGGVAAQATNVRIQNCTLRNNAGACCIVMGQTNTAGLGLGSQWWLLNNRFLDNGLDTNDHSCVFGWANDVVAFGNLFQNADAPTYTGMKVGYEIHGGRHTLIANRFINGLRGIWVAYNNSQPAVRNKIIGNHFACTFYGVDFFGGDSYASLLSDTLVEANDFVFDDTVIAVAPALTQKVAVQIASAYGQKHITVRGNRATMDGTAVATAFCVITQGGTDATHGDIVIEDNDGHSLANGTYIRTSASHGLGAGIVIRRNNWFNLTPAGIVGTAVGDTVGYTTTPQTIVGLTVGDGSCIDDRGSPQCANAQNVAGTFTNLTRYLTSAQGLSGATYVEDPSISITNRQGVYDNSVAYAGTTLTNGSSTTISLSLPGVKFGDLVQASYNGDLQGCMVSQPVVTSTGNVGFVISNNTGSSKTLAAGLLYGRYWTRIN